MRPQAFKKRLIQGDDVDVNQLMPIKYTWAWELSLSSYMILFVGFGIRQAFLGLT